MDHEGRYNSLTFTPTRADPVGIDLFVEEINGTVQTRSLNDSISQNERTVEEINGTVQTTIYKRFSGGPPDTCGRIFARSVDPSAEDHDETVAAWIDGAEQVRDFRPEATRKLRGARDLLSGAIGAIRAQTRDGDLTAAAIAETLSRTLSPAEKDGLRSVMDEDLGAPQGGPPIDAGSEWTDDDGPDFTVQSISVDEDGVPQVQIREDGGRVLSVPAEDIRRRAAAGEIRRLD
jgi:hypothetical protein